MNFRKQSAHVRQHKPFPIPAPLSSLSSVSRQTLSMSSKVDRDMGSVRGSWWDLRRPAQRLRVDRLSPCFALLTTPCAAKEKGQVLGVRCMQATRAVL